MGFRPRKTTYSLRFEDDEDLAGLEVEIASVTVAEWNEMLRGAALPDNINPESIAANDGVLGVFAKSLISWNLESEDGIPVPCDLQGVLSQERPIIQKLITAWQLALVGVRPELGKGSSSGADSAAEETLGLGGSSTSLLS